MHNSKISEAFEQSVLCWLATVDNELQPNVSPKEMFVLKDENKLLIANIASPVSVRNIKSNAKVSVSLVDVFRQKGVKLYGLAKIIERDDPEFASAQKLLTDKFSDRFPIRSVIEVEITKVFPILAPSYILFPETTEEAQIESARKRYRI